MNWAREHATTHPGHTATESRTSPGYCTTCGEHSPAYQLAEPTFRITPPSNVREAAERFQAAMDDVRRAANAVENQTRELEIYAREQAGDIELTASARKAYRDMADRLKDLIGG